MDTTRKFPLILSSFWLKIIALFTMTIDHIGYMLEDGRFYELRDLAISFRYIGRLALPLFCFMIAEGALHTKNFKKYALRLGIMASLISIGMIIAENVSFIGSMRREGIIFVDLLLGAVAVYCLRQKKWYFKLLALLPLLYGIASFIGASLELCGCHGKILWFPYFMRCQYGWYGILMCILFYMAHLLSDAFISYLSGQTGITRENYKSTNIERHSINIISVLMLALAGILYYVVIKMMPEKYVATDNNMQLFAIASGAFILLYNGLRGYNKKWFQYGSYLYYPIHLAIIYFIFSLI